MSTSGFDAEPLAIDVSFPEGGMRVVLSDGRELTVPLEWFPRLRNATRRQRRNWELIGGGIGIHWEEIDEDISVESLLSPGKTILYRESARPTWVPRIPSKAKGPSSLRPRLRNSRRSLKAGA